MNIVMIAVHKTEKKIIGYRLLDTDSGQVKDVPQSNVYSILYAREAEVENIGLEGNRIVGTNGKLQRYPVLVNGQLRGKSPLIILFELVDNRYRVANYTGEIVDIDEIEAIKYSETEGIANGKIVCDNNGNKFISSIKGTYKQDKLARDREYGETLKLKMGLLGVRNYELDDRYYARATDENIEELMLGRGILGIQEKGFKDMRKLKDIYLPNTLMSLGMSGFEGCVSLETIEIPEGIVEIPRSCFSECVNLREVTFPNSLRKVCWAAFYNCRKLKKIYCGPAPIEFEYGALPRGVRRIRRQSIG